MIKNIKFNILKIQMNIKLKQKKRNILIYLNKFILFIEKIHILIVILKYIYEKAQQNLNHDSG